MSETVKRVEKIIGGIGGASDKVSFAKNSVEATNPDNALKSINAAIDLAKTTIGWLEMAGKSIDPRYNKLTNTAKLANAIREVEQDIAKGDAVKLGVLIDATTAAADMIGDTALTRGAIVPGLAIKGASTTLSYIGLVWGDTVVIPKQTQPSEEHMVNISVTTIKDADGNPLFSFDSNGRYDFYTKGSDSKVELTTSDKQTATVNILGITSGKVEASLGYTTSNDKSSLQLKDTTYNEEGIAATTATTTISHDLYGNEIGTTTNTNSIELNTTTPNIFDQTTILNTLKDTMVKGDIESSSAYTSVYSSPDSVFRKYFDTNYATNTNQSVLTDQIHSTPEEAYNSWQSTNNIDEDSEDTTSTDSILKLDEQSNTTTTNDEGGSGSDDEGSGEDGSSDGGSRDGSINYLTYIQETFTSKEQSRTAA